jgi:hypothetical protein
MSNEAKTPIARLKLAMIAELMDTIENGMTVVDKESGEVIKLSCPANILAVAAKVVKDFHSEVGVEASMNELTELVKNYRLRKSGQVTAH